jgi:aspartate/methionine/tyrosine aminotransferase
MTLASRTENISPFYVVQVLKQVAQLEASGMDVIRLFVGEPDFETPSAIMAKAKYDLMHEPQGYTSSTGIPELKKKIAERYHRWHGLTLSPDRVIVAPGGSAALQVAFLANLNPGDEVLLPEPGYPCNANLLEMVNAKGVSVYLDPNHKMALNLEALEAAITEKTKALLIASPSNPLGSVMSIQQWQDVTKLCEKHSITVFADEIYHGLTFEGIAPTALEVNDSAWVLQSFSKFYGMTGWRLGWLVVPEYAIDACERIAQNLYLSSPSLAQQAALAGFEPEVEAKCFERRDELKARRDYLVEALSNIGLAVMANPDGAFYLYVDISEYSNDALVFCRDLLDQHGVALTPGLDFGGPCPDTSVRIAYTVGVERLKEAVTRIQLFLEALK